jgi:hypothetical protein
MLPPVSAVAVSLGPLTVRTRKTPPQHQWPLVAATVQTRTRATWKCWPTNTDPAGDTALALAFATRLAL